MRIQPQPDRAPLSLGGVMYHFYYKKQNYRVDAGNVDADASHIHNCYEIYLNISGNVSFLVNNRIYPICRGDLIITRPGDVHVCIYHNDCLHEHFCLWLDAPQGHPLISFAEKENTAFLRPEPQAREEIIAAFWRLQERSGAAHEPATTAALLEIGALLSAEERYVAQEAPHADIPAELQKILDLINVRFFAYRSVADLLEDTYVSAATLNRWFRRYVHLSPRMFLEAKKLSYAKELLRRGSSVSEASEKAGFSDCSYFIAIFRRKFGQTPLRYKQSLARDT